MSIKKASYGFGFDPIESLNHFYVVIPPKESLDFVRVYERFNWTDSSGGEAESSGFELEANKKYANGQIIEKGDVLRLEISRHKWSLLSKDISAEFNSRLKAKGEKSGRFDVGGTPVERLLGKELMVLLWGVENCDPSNIPTAIRNWKGLMPEERWWLYTMTNASTGHIKDKKGWRTALRYALCENPIEETQPDLFENLDAEDVTK